MTTSSPEIRACGCGKIPAITEETISQIHILRIECACRNRGTAMLYTKPADRAKMLQAALDGWNMRL